MDDRILVTYASRTGSTAGVAAAIADVLTERGGLVDLAQMENVNTLAPYRAVVAGSAINGGQWLPEGMDFLTRHREALATRPVAAFLVCITMSLTNPDHRKGVPGYLKSVREIVHPVREGYFAGGLDFSKMPRYSPVAFGFRVAAALGALKTGDHRDWAAIQAWADEVADVLDIQGVAPLPAVVVR